MDANCSGLARCQYCGGALLMHLVPLRDSGLDTPLVVLRCSTATGCSRIEDVRPVSLTMDGWEIVA